MKITIQNGATHPLSRREIESIVCLFPAAWSYAVDAIVLYQGGSELTAKLYARERKIGLFWPLTPTYHTKADAIEVLLVALAIIAERGDLPKRIAPSIRSRALNQISNIYQKCLTAVGLNAA
ncbi:hypothetical protein GM658_07795 [Pseudoduganella eburnea]|uniref:Uncharacterized protein n=1 Tax=Massilia eburnea TaxID=1776165 RepID=A0A6L6QE48_9BURK|nr:hypothetical protein [Massilia eburnea]MTW10505.1 hypothetical protein [Massilia eburnea]